MRRPTRTFSRRSFLRAASIGAGALTMRSWMLPRVAQADPTNPRYFVFCYFHGGWDQLMAFDPRDQTLPQYQEAAAYSVNGSGIFPAYDQITDSTVAAVLAAHPSGIQTPAGVASSPLTFGPAVPSSLIAHSQELCIVRGINMGIPGHEGARRYFITGKPPQGSAANGSALPTAIAAQVGMDKVLPNLAVRVETYNDRFPAYASGLSATGPETIYEVLAPGGTALPLASDEALRAFEAEDPSCLAHELDENGNAQMYRDGRLKARQMIDADVAAHFAFAKPNAETSKLLSAFGASSSKLKTARATAALAAQAITKGIAQAVSIELAGSLDHHFGSWATGHAPQLREGLDALAALMTYLKSIPEPTGGTYFDHTTILAWSEFARTPLLNDSGGRDHHVASSCLLTGPGIKGNCVFGATSDVGMTSLSVDPKTGTPDTAGATVRPVDIHATVLTSMGLNYDHISNQLPVLLEGVLL